ncbi:MAG: two-component response regulator, CheY-like domain protein [Bacillota bacterium]|jgi:YesN/AraC family two-component response regulator|nr:two-component response regulator, CheY-like domain protein [Bacillota bacterium]
MKDLENLNVLYIEDDAATRDALSKFLKLRVGRMTSAASGEEGLEKFRAYRPNLLIVDLIMPGMSGLEMIGAIRKLDKDCPILITSTVSEVNTVLEAVDRGIVHYIIKPIDTEDLERKLSVIAEEIRRKQNRNRVFERISLEKRGVIEDALRREFLGILKNTSGKGPQDVKVLLFEDRIEFIAVEAWTTMEKTVSASRRNIAVAEQFRKLFYQEISEMLEARATQAAGCPMSVTSIVVDGLKRIDRIVLTIV